MASLGGPNWGGPGVQLSPQLVGLFGHWIQEDRCDLNSLQAFPDRIPTDLSLVSLPFRTRSANILRAQGWLSQPQELSVATLGQLLELKGMGGASLIDILAVVEAATASQRQASPTDGAREKATASASAILVEPPANSPSPVDRQKLTNSRATAVGAWGRPGTPLLPAAFRTVLRGEKAPDWLCRQLKIPDSDTSLEALTADVWRYGANRAPKRTLDFLIDRATACIGMVRHMHPFTFGIPSEKTLMRLPLSVRTRNCITQAAESAGVPAHAFLQSCGSYDVLLGLKGFGARSALDASCVIESAMGITVEIEVQYQEALRTGQISIYRNRLAEVLDQPWVNQISAQDPRFRDVIPFSAETIFERIERLTSGDENSADEMLIGESIPRIQERVAELSSLSLEAALRQLLEHTSGYNGDRLEAISGRFGWGGERPLTLEEAGKSIGVTRERLRQLEKAVLARMPTHDIFLPALDQALETLEVLSPIPCAAASQQLRMQGITSGTFPIDCILRIAQDFGRPEALAIRQTAQGPLLIARAGVEQLGKAADLARRIARRSGAVNIHYLFDLLQRENWNGSLASLRVAIQDVLSARFLSADWFWIPTERQNSPVKIALKIVSVITPVSVDSIREGIRRFAVYCESSHGWRYMETPPRAILEALFRAHPCLEVEEPANVLAAKGVATSGLISASERSLVEIFKTSPTGILDRATIRKNAANRGMNLHTLEVYLTYNPLIQHVAHNLWALRGSHLDPGVVAAMLEANAITPAERRVVGHGWTARRQLWIAARLPEHPSHFVLGVPAGARRLLDGRAFVAKDKAGLPCGTLRINDEGSLYGFDRYLNRSGADSGDHLFVFFNLVAGDVELRLGTNSDLELLDPTG